MGINVFYHSKDSGVSFHPSSTAPDVNSNMKSIAMSSDGSTILLNSNSGDMYISTDHGDTFTITGNGFNRQISLMACSDNAEYVFATYFSNTGIYMSNDTGANWTLVGDFPYTSFTSITCTPSGQCVYATGTDSSGSSYSCYSTNYGFNWTINRTITGLNVPPTIYYPFDNSVTDVMGGTPTVGGSPGFVQGAVGGYAINLANTPGSGATYYIRQAINSNTKPNFTTSFWFNTQNVPTGQTVIFELGTLGSDEGFTFCTGTSNSLYVQYQMPGAAWGSHVVAASTSPNTWYHFYMTFTHNGMCDIYLNHKLAVSFPANFDFYVPLETLSIGCYVVHTGGAYTGYIDDFRFYNAVMPMNVTIPSVYIPFENNSAADVMNGTTLTVNGTIDFTTGPVINAGMLINTAGGYPDNFIIGTWSGSYNFSGSFWFNLQSLGAIQSLFSAYGTGFYIYVDPSNQLIWSLPSGGGTTNTVIYGPTLISNNWYKLVFIFQSNDVCSLYLNNQLVGSTTNIYGVGARTTSHFAIGTYDEPSYGQALNGYIDDFRFYEMAINVPTISIPFDNSVTDIMGGTPNVFGSPSYRPGKGNDYAIVLNNNPGDYASDYITQSINLSTTPNFTVSCIFNVQAYPTTYQTFIFEMGTNFDEVLSLTVAGNGALNLQCHTSTDSWEFVPISSSISINTWYSVVIHYITNGNCSVYLDNSLVATFRADFSLYTPCNVLCLGGSCLSGAHGGLNGYIDDFRVYFNKNTFNPYIPTLTSITCDSTGANVVASADDVDYLYRSTNYNNSFSLLNKPNNNLRISSVKSDSTGDKLLLGEITNGGVYYSTDAGSTWTLQSVSMNYGSPLYVNMTSDGTYLFAFQASSDTFINAFSSGLVPWNVDSRLIYSICLSSDNQRAIGVDDDSGIPIYSSDGGATWSDANTFPDVYPAWLAMDYSGQYVVGAWSNNGIYRSTDYGNNYTQLMSAPSYNWSYITCSYTGQYIYACIWDNPPNGYIYISSDSGNTFTQVDPAGASRYWGKIACSASGQHVYAQCWNGDNGWSSEMYYSSNYGQTWTFMLNPSSHNIEDVACDSTGQYVVITCGTDGIYRSTDYGSLWSRTGAFYESPYGPVYTNIVCNASGQQILAINDTNAVLYRSLDSGVTWDAQYLPGNYNSDGYSLSISLDGSKQYAELFLVGTFSKSSRTDTIPNPSVPCFLEGTKILCKINNKEEYVPVESIRPGTLVKTAFDGFKAVKLIGHRTMNNTASPDRSKNDLYLCSKAAYPELTEDLMITGCHAILVKKITDTHRANIFKTLERIYVTDNHYRLPACVDERATVVPTAGNYNVWHFALEHYDIKMNYGVYAQGLLVESSPIWHMNIKNYTLVQ